MRQTWKGINELIGSYKKKTKRNPTNFIRPNLNEVPTSDPKEISNILNKYFATVGSKLASKIPQTIESVHMTSRRPCWRSNKESSAMLEERSILWGIERHLYAHSSLCFIMQIWLLIT